MKMAGEYLLSIVAVYPELADGHSYGNNLSGNTI
jgi:hypothetical protein